MGTLFQDVRFGLRLLARSPGFTAMAVLALALGIGANTAIFSVVNAVLLHPVPFPEPERLVVVWSENPQRNWHQFPASLPDYLEWKGSGIFASLAAIEDTGYNLRLADRTERIDGVQVTHEFFAALRAKPLLGRFFHQDDLRPGHEHVAVLSESLWRSHFGAANDVLGRDVILSGAPHKVIGVFPKKMNAFGQPVVFVPLVIPAMNAAERGHRGVLVLGRLAPGVSLQAASRRITELSGVLQKRYPDYNAGISAELQPLSEAMVQDVQDLLLILLAVVGFVLLIACANVANLLLARGRRRERELAIRVALGAPKGRLFRQLLVESMLLALMGAAAGILPAMWAVDPILSFGIEDLPNAGDIGLDATVLAFTLAMGLATGVIFGLAPALAAARTNANDTLKSATAGGSPRGHRLRIALVVSQVALTLVLLSGAGLMLRGFHDFRRASPGYNARGVLMFTVALDERQYAAGAKRLAFTEDAMRRIHALPGVQAVAAASTLPTSSNLHGTGVIRTDRPEPALKDAQVFANDVVSPDYFRVLQIPLIKGRFFADTDRPGAPLVTIVDQEMARRLWPGEDPIGKTFRAGRDQPPRRVIGIAGEVRHPPGDASKIRGQFYLPLAQEPLPAMMFVLRAAGDPAILSQPVREIVRDIDVDQPVFETRTLEAARLDTWAQQRVAMLVLSAFAVLAISLAVIGIYGVVSYSVLQRTREIGIRLALGARSGDVVWMTLRETLWMALGGVGIGLPASFAASRLLASALPGVSTAPAPMLILAASLMTGIALAAALLPARRGARIDPVHALRCE